MIKWIKRWFGYTPKDSYLYVFEYNDGKPVMARKYKKD